MLRLDSFGRSRSRRARPRDSGYLIRAGWGNQLKVSVTAKPQDGRATDHMLRFLAREFDVPPSSIEVVFGRMNVNKQLRIPCPKRLPSVFQIQTSLLE
ncbi:DUF167 domain-containing protein [Acidithiobacillus sulfurivorans]|uniref:DUF167 domain-containing protein n=1 Tax=Acidithiobacillus sulfurivorans TaxID=1958756 RepID=UPI001D02173D|nr:DUF167 domain-containing protein [Acidithiobacillus sulfurivorans]